MIFRVKHGAGTLNPGPRVSYFEIPAFHDAFIHGLSILLGGIFGLCVFVSFQPLPEIKPYLFEKILKTPIPVKQPAAPVKLSPEQADALLGPTPTPPDQQGDTKTSPEPTIAPASSAPGPASVSPLSKDAQPPVPTSSVIGGPGAPIVQEPLASTEPAQPAPPAAAPPVPAVTPPPTAPLIPFPAPGMTENKPPYGPLPIIRTSDEIRPFDVYRQPFAAENLKKPLLALVVLDMGLSEKTSTEFLKSMPKGTTMVMSRNSRNIQNLVDQARSTGFEVWADLAVEPPKYPSDDPGANALFSNASIDQNLDALYQQLGSFGGYAGIFISSSSPYLSNNQDAEFLSDGLFKRGLSVAINAIQVDGIFLKNAKDQKMPYYQGSMLRLEEPALAERFIKVAENQALTQGYSILVVTPNAAVRKKIETWVSKLSDKGIVIAPLSVMTERGIHLMAGR